MFQHRNVTDYGDTWGQTLYLRRVRTSDTGWYTCLVANMFGSSHASAWLEVITEVEAKARAHTSSAAIMTACSWTVCASSLRTSSNLLFLLTLFCVHWTWHKLSQAS